MEYPNKNLQIVLTNEAKRIERESFLFGDSLFLSAPKRQLGLKTVLKKYGSKVRRVILRD